MRVLTAALFGAVVLLCLQSSGPRSSVAVAAWLRSDAVEARTIAVGDRLAVAATGTAAVQAASPEVITIDAGQDFTMIGVMCAVSAAEGDVVLRLRTSLDGRDWSAWYESPLEVAAEDGGAARAFTDAMWTGEGRYVQIGARAEGAAAPRALQGVRVMAIDTNPEGTLSERLSGVVRGAAARVAALGTPASAAAAVDTPAWVTRAGWGADESLRSGTPQTAPVRMAVVHHTAGANTYTREEAPGVVRGIYVYHTKGLGWNDIGYNFLIDRFGTVYVGRHGGPRQGVVGAHAYGFNTGSTGVALLGTYTSATPPAAALASLEHLLAWKLELHGLDPLGKATMTCGGTDLYEQGQTVELPVIAGHRDVNRTVCPGDALYTKLPELRRAVAARTAASTPAPYTVTLTLSAAEVTAGKTVTYAGRVTTATGAAARGKVTVQKRRAPDGAWCDWRTATLAADGGYAVAVAMTTPDRDWQFRARMPGDALGAAGASAIRPLHVGAAPYAVSLTLSGSDVKPGTKVTYRGTVKTADGRAGAGNVTLQKRRKGSTQWLAWRTLALRNGAYATTVAMTTPDRDWQFRVRMPGNALGGTGFSPVRGLHVRSR